jgi:hypothetical protein
MLQNIYDKFGLIVVMDNVAFQFKTCILVELYMFGIVQYMFYKHIM